MHQFQLQRWKIKNFAFLASISLASLACQPMTPQGKRATGEENPNPIVTPQNSVLQFEIEDSFKLTDGQEDRLLGIKLEIYAAPKDAFFPINTDGLTNEFSKIYEEQNVAEPISLEFELEKYGQKILQIEIIDNELSVAKGQSLVRIGPGKNEISRSLQLELQKTELAAFEFQVKPQAPSQIENGDELLTKSQQFVDTYCISCHAFFPGEDYPQLLETSFDGFVADLKLQKVLEGAVLRSDPETAVAIMPPADSETQPSDEERKTFLSEARLLGSSLKQSLDMETLKSVVQKAKLELRKNDEEKPRFTFTGELMDEALSFAISKLPVDSEYKATLVLEYGNGSTQSFELAPLKAASENPSITQTTSSVIELNKPVVDLQIRLEIVE